MDQEPIRIDEDTLRKFVEQAYQEEVGRLVDQTVPLLAKLFNRKGDAREFEQSFRGVFMSLGTGLLGKVLGKYDKEILSIVRQRGHRDAQGELCHGSIPSKGVKKVTITSLLGPFEIKRTTVHCRTCGKNSGTAEEMLNLVTEQHLTPGAASVGALSALAFSFGKSESNVEQTVGIRLTDTRIHRLVAQVGSSATRLLRTRPELLEDPERTLPPLHRTLNASLDGGRIRFRGGDWREPCSGILWWEGLDGKLRRFVFAEVKDKERILKILDAWLERYQRVRKGRPLIVADGALWIWEWARTHPGAVWVLDYYHLKETVWKAADVVYGEGTPKARRFVEKIMDRVWRGWVVSTAWKLARMRPNSSAKHQALIDLGTYLINHLEMVMDYRRLKRTGRAIGSGHMESSIKQIFTMRLKGPGMFWSEKGAQHVMHLRALYISGRWEELWSDVHRRGWAAVGAAEAA